MRYGDISFSSYRKRHGLLDIGQPLFSLNRRVIEAESSLLVLPLVHERFGLLLPEAMAAGLPVVGTDETGATQCVTTGVDEFVVPSRNIDALAEAIVS